MSDALKAIVQDLLEDDPAQIEIIPVYIWWKAPRLHKAVFYQIFGNLNRIGSGTFPQIIGYNPHI